MARKSRNERLYFILMAIPSPNIGGTKTSTALGFINYAQDMIILQETLKVYHFNLMLEAGRHKYASPEDFGAEWPNFVKPDEILKRIESWIKQRKAENWEHISGISEPEGLVRMPM